MAQQDDRTRADDEMVGLFLGRDSGYGITGETDGAEGVAPSGEDAAFAQAGSSGGGSDVYQQRAQSYLRNYASQFGPGFQWPRAFMGARSVISPFVGDELAGINPSDPAMAHAIRDLGAKLFAAGYLSESGSFDPGQVINALAEVEEDKDNLKWGGSTDSYLSSLIRTNSTLGKEDKRKFTPQPFVKPSLEKLAQEEMERAIEQSFTSVLGRQPTDEELHRFASEFRSAEARSHEQRVGVAREIHGVQEQFRRTQFEGGGGESRTVDVGPIEQAPSPGTLTEEGLEDTDEAKAFHGARLGLDLLSALKGGF